MPFTRAVPRADSIGLPLEYQSVSPVTQDYWLGTKRSEYFAIGSGHEALGAFVPDVPQSGAHLNPHKTLRPQPSHSLPCPEFASHVLASRVEIL